jgi:hypothetical protein
MMCHCSSSARVLLITSMSCVAMLSTGGAAPPAASAPADPPALPVAIAPASPGDAQAGYLPEVHLRKLHLVRPDLIPYPIAYEVYC